MSQIISRCGLICSECPAYVATQKDDNQMRATVAADWSKEFGGSFKPEGHQLRRLPVHWGKGLQLLPRV